MKTYDGFYGYTYYYKNGVLKASPTFADGGFDQESEMDVSDFEEPLTEAEMEEVITNLK